MSEMSEFNELLEQVRSAGDLRRKETTRLIEAAKKVSVAIADAARDAGITVTLPLSLWEKRRLAIVKKHKVWGLAVQEEVAPSYAEYEEWCGEPFALATGTEMSNCWEIPADNPHNLPAGAAYQQGRWLYYHGSQENIPLTPAQAEEIAQWLPTLKQPLAEPSESLTRSQWIEVAGQLVPLAKKLVEVATQAATETTTAADLAERLKNAI